MAPEGSRGAPVGPAGPPEDPPESLRYPRQASKTMSMMVVLVGQLYFRFKHKDKTYAIRTNYTIKTNKEWNELNRKNRITKKKTLKNDVDKTISFLKNKK